MNLPEFKEDDYKEFFAFFKSNYFNNKFSTLTKGDVETYLFHFLIKKYRKINSDGYYVDDSSMTDFKMACLLGVTPQKIRSLKMKERLLFPDDQYDWKKQLLAISSQARYDTDKKRVILNVSDNWLFANIQDCLEEKGEPIEMQLNGKILQIPLPYYIDLMIETYKGEKKDIEDIIKKDLDIKDKKIDFKKLGILLKEHALNLTTLCANLATIIPNLSNIK